MLLIPSLTPASAVASYDPIASGTTKLTLDRAFTRLLSSNAVKLRGRGGATVRGSVATLPSAGGRADPTIKKAEIELGGELILSRPGGRVALTEITLKTKHTPIYAKVGGGQLKLASATGVSLERLGFGNRLSATGLRLTAKAATRLDKRLHTEAFAAGQRLGTLAATAQPATLAVLPSGSASLAIDPAIAAKLNADSTSLNPIFPAEHLGASFNFPIAAQGTIAPDGRAGEIRLAGSLELLRLGAGQIFWNEPWLELASHTATAELDTEPTPAFPGKQGRLAVLDLGAATIASNPASRIVTLSNAPLTLNASSAAAFNAGFAGGRPEFLAGELLGTLTFSARTQ